MATTVGMGVVGAGAIGIRAALTHLSQPDVQDRVRLTAVCDPVPGRAKAAAETYDVPAWYESYEELLDDPNVDAVTLCSPIGIHYEQGLQAIEAGKHVHFNKTMTTKVSEADHLIEAAAEKGVILVASPGMMLMPPNRRARKAVLEGELGKLVWAGAGATGVGDYHLNEEFRTGEDILTDVDPSWYYRKPGGGPQYDVTVYCLHNLTGIVGPAQRVTAMSGLVIPEREYHGKPIECDMDDSTFLLLDFGDAFYAFVYATVTGGLFKGFNPNIYGTAGALVGGELNGESLQQPGDHEPHVTGKHQELRESHVFEDMMQLVDWIRDGTPSIASAEHARHVIDIIEAGYRAAETGETQELRTTFDPLPLEALT
ncbi:MAG: Gfo/Idh/MocA family protein [Anaerolineae bacterium]